MLRDECCKGMKNNSYEQRKDKCSCRFCAKPCVFRNFANETIGWPIIRALDNPNNHCMKRTRLLSVIAFSVQVGVLPVQGAVAGYRPALRIRLWSVGRGEEDVHAVCRPRRRRLVAVAVLGERHGSVLCSGLQ